VRAGAFDAASAADLSGEELTTFGDGCEDRLIWVGLSANDGFQGDKNIHGSLVSDFTPDRHPIGARVAAEEDDHLDRDVLDPYPSRENAGRAFSGHRGRSCRRVSDHCGRRGTVLDIFRIKAK
jgi:hypothetical protein